jgi:hypothetical protein
MILEDPDKDILDAIAWKEQRLQIVHAFAAVAAAVLVFLALFALMAFVLKWQSRVSLDSAAVVGIALGAWFLFRLNRPR